LGASSAAVSSAAFGVFGFSAFACSPTGGFAARARAQGAQESDDDERCRTQGEDE